MKKKEENWRETLKKKTPGEGFPKTL